MNFINGILGLVDDVWKLLTIPAFIIFGYWLVILFPVIGLLLAFFLISMDMRTIDYCNGVISLHNTKSDNMYANTFDQTIIDKYSEQRKSYEVNILLIMIITAVSFAMAIHHILGSHFEMCENTDIIPFSLVDLLRTFVQHKC